MLRLRFPSMVSGLALAAALVGPSSARAQFPIADGPVIDMSAAGIPPAGSLVSPTEAPALGSRGVTYATPPFSEARRKARVANRYTVARPVYNGRPGFSFAPYSDYYFPRTIGARETVYTAGPNAPVPVGFRAFARPGTTQAIPH